MFFSLVEVSVLFEISSLWNSKMSKKRYLSPDESFHTILKVPLGETPYVKAKYVQLVEKNVSKAIALFWAAINGGDRVDSALKDMTLLMKQQNRAEEAIEAIKSFRHLCPDQSQESLDNVLLELYRRCGRLDDEIGLLQHKIYCIKQGISFKGRKTKPARSQGRRFQVSKSQEIARLLGNLGWAYMQQSNFTAAEAEYREALSMGPDDNKVCNLGICLLKQGRLVEAKNMLVGISPPCSSDTSHHRSYQRAQEILGEIEGCLKLEETTKSGLKILPEVRLMDFNGSKVSNSKEDACFPPEKNSGRRVRHKLEHEGYEAFNGKGFVKFSPLRNEEDEKYGIHSPTRLDFAREIIIGKQDDDLLYQSFDNKHPYGNDKAHANIWTNLSYCENALEFLQAKRVRNRRQACEDGEHYANNLPAAVEIEGSEHRRRLRVFEEMTANVDSP